MTMLAVVLPILCFAVLLNKDNFRESFLFSAITCGLFVAISTELLSRFELISYVPLVFSWILFLAVLLVWRYRRGKTVNYPLYGELTADQKILVILLASVACIGGIAAIVAAPNNFDSLTYHLPRVMHWIQNKSVEHYPTNIDRQLILAPLSEFAIMHLQILAGSDRFANCVQWFSMVGSTVAVTLIVRALQGSLNAQLVAAAIALSLPMGLLQATSTQNDYAVTFWLVCLTYFVVKARKDCTVNNTVLVGVCLALAVFTKGTAYLIAFPFMLVYLWGLIAKGFKFTVYNVLIVLALLLLINGSHYARNMEVYGNPISPGTGNDIVCTQFDSAAFISCITKNIATQLESHFRGANMLLRAMTKFIHHTIGIDVNDPDLTMDRGFHIVRARFHADYAPNPLHMTLMILGTGVLLVRRKSYSRETILFATAAMLSFVTLSVAIKWNPFISRYFLPVFIISAPCLSLLFDGNRLKPLVNLCAAGLLLTALVVLANNEMRPLIGPKSVFVTDRIDQYFMARPEAKPYFVALDNSIKKKQISNIGIVDTDGNMWEYALWVLLKDNGVNYRIEHVDVNNLSAKIPLEDFSNYYSVQF